MRAVADCVLCHLYAAENHPAHSEAPRFHGHDYEALRQRQRRGRLVKNARIRLVYGGCERKVKYETPGRAKRAAKRIGNPSVHAFHCRHCGGFHVGKSDKVGA